MNIHAVLFTDLICYAGIQGCVYVCLCVYNEAVGVPVLCVHESLERVVSQRG